MVNQMRIASNIKYRLWMLMYQYGNLQAHLFCLVLIEMPYENNYSYSLKNLYE